MAANPMVSQYVDPVINAYPSLDRQVQPGFKAQEKMKNSDSISKLLAESRHRYELRVFNVPMEMTEDGLRNCFGKYGRIIEFFLSKSSHQAFQWAKISYATPEEAESAIENLHQTPPHQFDVNFYKSNEERHREKMEENSRLDQGALINRRQDDFHRGKINDIPPNLVSEKQRQLDEKAKSMAYPKVHHGIKGLPFNHYFRGEVDDSAGSDDWTHVQGYIPVVIPRNHLYISDEDRQPFILGYPKILPNEAPIGKCAFCHEQGRYRCSKCKDWYCSQKCQLDDWPQHKNVCRAAPVLEKCDGSVFIPPSRRLRQPNKKNDEDSGPAESNGDVSSKPHSEPKTAAPKEEIQQPTYVKIEPPKPSIEAAKPSPLREQKDESKSVPLQASNEQSPTDAKDRLLKALNVEPEVKPTEVKPKGPEPSKTQVSSEPMEIPSILKSMKIHNKTEIMSDLESGSVAQFFGTITQEPNPTLDFLIGKFESCLQGAEPLTKVEIGQYVAVKDEGMFQRCLVIDKYEKQIEVADIDNYRPGQRITLESGSVFALPVEAYDLPALSVICKAQNEIKDSLAKIIKAEFSEGTLEARIIKVKEIPRQKKPFVEVVLLSKNGKDLVHYALKPWTSLDQRIAKALKIPNDVFLVEDFEDEKLKLDDQVVFITFGPSNSNTFVAMNQKHADYEGLIMNVMSTQGPNQSQLDIKNLVANQIVTCKWSEDDSFYRALVKEIKADEKKVKVRFIDYGNVSTEPISNIRQLPDASLHFPMLGKLVILKDVPALKYSDISVKNKLKQLEPLMEGPMKITEVTNEGLTLTHLNGNTVNKIFAEKLAEPSGSIAPPEIQAADADGQFKYDKAHIAALISDKPDLKQDVTILHADSPCSIFVCPNDQIGLADNITKEVSNYAGINEKLVGFSPRVGDICLAKSQDDEAWYRATCKHYNDQNYEMFFVDFGFTEVLPRERLKVIDPMLMKTVFLANHCVLEGFEDADKAEAFTKQYGAKVTELLPFMHQTKVKVVAKKDGYFVAKFGELKDMKPETEKERQIRELQEQLAKLTG